MIKIKERPEGNPLIVSSVSDFCDSMGYCEFKIKHFLKGVRPPQTEITMAGTKAHKDEEEYEKEHFEFVPITEEELTDLEKDVEFVLEWTLVLMLVQVKELEKVKDILLS